MELEQDEQSARALLIVRLDPVIPDSAVVRVAGTI